MAKQKRVAYFCMEFGLHHSFRSYAGGLGILAGDILKAAKDESLPLIGVGLLWRQGYVQQGIDERGIVTDTFSDQLYDFLKDTGVEVSVTIRRREVRLKVYKCDCFGNVPLYLLDANLEDNGDRLITGQLYGWFDEERVAQEIILGIGGVRALRALKIPVDVYHFNDSHPVIAGTELIGEELKKGKSFDDALSAVRHKVVFTTHTPVVHGNEKYSYELLKYMGAYNSLTHSQLLQIGSRPFSMTVAGLRLSKKANAVSQLHGKTANAMWRYVKRAAPIIAITNGVHNATWQDARVKAAFERGEGLWDAHLECKRDMLKLVREKTGAELLEDTLTIGFARRAAPYKRSDLLFRTKEGEALVASGKVQLVFSGKAHPNDLTGKEILENLHAMSEKYENVVFIPDYDMQIGAALTRGCDVWLNNPKRPLEACGTSGMKAAMNGVLNVSILDGWWDEACVHGENGWQFGDGYEGKDADTQDAKALVRVLKDEVIPIFYSERERYISMMNRSIRDTSIVYSASRMVIEYYEQMYE